MGGHDSHAGAKTSKSHHAPEREVPVQRLPISDAMHPDLQDIINHVP
jgi:hypothetical protein